MNPQDDIIMTAEKMEALYGFDGNLHEAHGSERSVLINKMVCLKNSASLISVWPWSKRLAVENLLLISLVRLEFMRSTHADVDIFLRDHFVEPYAKITRIEDAKTWPQIAELQKNLFGDVFISLMATPVGMELQEKGALRKSATYIIYQIISRMREDGAHVTAYDDLLATFHRDNMSETRYLSRTNEVAFYPGANTGDSQEIAYLTLGLIGELRELASSQSHKEAGDVMWYAMRLCACLGEYSAMFSLREHMRGTDIAAGLTTGSKSGISNFGADLHRLTQICGAMANVAKKYMRDHAVPGEQQKRDKSMRAHLQEFAHVFSHMLWQSKIGAGAVMSGNIEKLMSRKRRDKLTGSGDDR